MKRNSLLRILLLCALAGTARAEAVKDIDLQPVEPPALDLAQVEALRTADGFLAFRVTCVAEPDPQHLRILIDLDGPQHGEPASGADYMLEGSRFYRYPEGARDWTWDAIDVAVVVGRGKTLTCIVPGLAIPASGAWYAETTRSDWSSADRLPASSLAPFRRDALPVLEPQRRLPPVDINALIEHSPRSLSFRLDAELKNIQWQRAASNEVRRMAWQPAFMKAPLLLDAFLTDAATSERIALRADEMLTFSNAACWTGKALGIDWLLVGEPAADGGFQITGQLSCESDRCVRVEIGSSLNLAGWVWHDDFRFRRPIAGRSGLFENTDPVPFGAGRQSYCPFGVVGSDQGALCAETDPAEPRVFQIFADAGRGFFGIGYDLALTSLTSNFPGRATFRCAFRSDAAGGPQAFRRALQRFHDRQPRAADCRPPDDPLAGAVEPALYRAALQPGTKSLRETVRHMMELQSEGDDRRAALASAALLGGAQRPDASLDMQLSGETSPEASLAVDLDPDLRPAPGLPVTPAMAQWQWAQDRIEQEGAGGFCLQALSALERADYSPAALGVADYPCTFQTNVLRPCLPAAWGAFEYLAAFSSVQRAAGRCVAADIDSPFAAFFVMHLDGAAGVEPQTGQPARDGLLDYWRAISGRKTVTVAPAETRVQIEPFYRECLFRGFFPARKAGSDEALAASYQPIARRLAEAGWQPVGVAASDSESIWVESFGKAGSAIRHLTVKNLSENPVRAGVSVGAAERAIAVNPLTAECQVIESNTASFTVSLLPRGIEAWDIVPLSAVDEELAFLRSWKSGFGEAEACVKSIESIRSELAAGLVCRTVVQLPPIDDEKNLVNVELKNRGPRTFVCTDVKVVASRHFRTVSDNPEKIEPGMMYEFGGTFESNDVAASPWIEVQWTLQSPETNLTCARMIKPALAPALEFRPGPRRVESGGPEAAIEVAVRSFSRYEREVRVRWRGDFEGGEREETIPAGAERVLRLPVKAGTLREGRMTVEARYRSQTLFREPFDVTFTSARGNP